MTPNRYTATTQQVRSLWRYRSFRGPPFVRIPRWSFGSSSFAICIPFLLVFGVQGLQRSLPTLREDLDRFGKARRTHLQECQEFKAPTAREAANAAVERVSDTATVALGVASDTATLALGAASEGIDRLGGFLGRARDKSKAWRRERPSDTEQPN